MTDWLLAVLAIAGVCVLFLVWYWICVWWYEWR